MALDIPTCTIWIDYACGYSDRLHASLTAVGPDRLEIRYRLFALEQVNSDASATEWRLWDQPFQYEHYRGHRRRRSLHSFVVTKLLEEDEPDPVVAAFRTGVFDARFRTHRDTSDLAVLRSIAGDAGADVARLDAKLADPDAVARARVAIAEDYHAARATWETFGVPTVAFGDDGEEGAADDSAAPPLYIRLSRPLEPDEARAFVTRLVDLHRSSPWLLELKAPERRPADAERDGTVAGG